VFQEILPYTAIALALAGIAAGRLPFLRMNRASMALAFAALLVAMGAIGLDEALASIDAGTIVLLLAMMLLVANLRLAGFFTAAGARILSVARTPRSLLFLVVMASGFLSALFLNDTICLMLTPLVVELALRSERDPLPYLVGVAVSANIGSCATIIGNPQNILIGASSGIGFGPFLVGLGPVSLAGLGLAWLAVLLAFPKEFRRGTLLKQAARSIKSTDRVLIAKSLLAAGLMLALLLAGVKPPLAALVAASILLFTRRISPERVFGEVDFSLLVFFAGLFIITRAIALTPAFAAFTERMGPLVQSSGSLSLAIFAGLTALLSNLVSNVPAVMLLRPLATVFADQEKAWLVLAMASTFAGNLTLLGSVANLIVAEGAKREGVHLGFGAYLKVGLPLTLVTIAAGTLYLLAT
jgi:Na+/H+ antiporter NhaD/arsenite permease-like protein